MYISKVNDYVTLLFMNYDEAIQVLLVKYGPVKDNYFKKKSYERFLNGEIKTIQKGNYQRTNEGLVCHHILENEYLNLSDLSFIYDQSVPFEVQKAKNLIYCDYFEHLILHVIITRETNLHYGYPGYRNYLKPNCNDWFCKGKIPYKIPWMMNCYNRAFLPKKEARFLLKILENEIENLPIVKKSKKRRKEEKRLYDLRWKEINRQKRKIRAKELQNDFICKYPLFEKMNITSSTPRNKLLELLYFQQDNSNNQTIQEFKKESLNKTRDTLLDELYAHFLNLDN